MAPYETKVHFPIFFLSQLNTFFPPVESSIHSAAAAARSLDTSLLLNVLGRTAQATSMTEYSPGLLRHNNSAHKVNHFQRISPDQPKIKAWKWRKQLSGSRGSLFSRAKRSSAPRESQNLREMTPYFPFSLSSVVIW